MGCLGLSTEWSPIIQSPARVVSHSTLHGFQSIAVCTYLYKDCKSSVLCVDVLCVTLMERGVGSFQKEPRDPKSEPCIEAKLASAGGCCLCLCYGSMSGCKGSHLILILLPPPPPTSSPHPCLAFSWEGV